MNETSVQERGPEPPFVLEEEHYRQWVAAHHDEEILGYSCDLCRCAIACYIAETYGVKPVVSGYKYRLEDGECYYMLPLWASDETLFFDKMTDRHEPVTARRYRLMRAMEKREREEETHA